MPRITDFELPLSVLTRFLRGGATVLHHVLTPSKVRALSDAIDANLANVIPLSMWLASQPDDPGHFVEDFCTSAIGSATRPIAA